MLVVLSKLALLLEVLKRTQNIQTDSPTYGKESLRVVLSTAASNRCYCKSIAVKAALLQGASLKCKVFLWPPPEALAGSNIWELITCVYGLNEKMKPSKYDLAIFYCHKHGVLEGIITCHIDDFIWFGTNNFSKKIIDKLWGTFRFGSEHSGMFKYLGLYVQQQHDKRILVH